jgi:NADH-quinone oxidoreductase subunit M
VLLSLIVVPLLGAAVAAVLSGPKARWVAVAVATATVGLGFAPLFGGERGGSGLWRSEIWPWMDVIGSRLHLGVDGTTWPLLPLSALVLLMIVVGSGSTQINRSWWSSLMLLHAATMVVVLAQDLIVFLAGWELILAPSFLLIAHHGVGASRQQAAIKYVGMMLTASAPLVLGIAWIGQLGRVEGLAYPYDLPELARVGIPVAAQLPLFWLTGLAFIAKTPLVPLHSWLPAVLEEGPAGFGVAVLGVKVGLIAFWKVSLLILPVGSAQAAPWMLGIAALTVLYASALLMVQHSLRRFMAYFGLLHTGTVTMGLFSGSVAGVLGAIISTWSLTLTATGLFFLAGALHARTRTTEVGALGGVVHRAPRLATAFFALGLAGIGLPGTIGFVGEHLVLLGTLSEAPAVGLVGLFGMVVGGIAWWKATSRAMFGPAEKPVVRTLSDLLSHEGVVAATFAVLAIIPGWMPGPFVALAQPAVHALVAP